LRLGSRREISSLLRIKPPSCTVNIIDEIRSRADERPEHPAVLTARRQEETDRPTTYSDLVRSLATHSRLLRSRIDGPARLIGLVAPQGVGFIEAALGVLDAGCCLVPLPDDQSESALRDLARRIGLHALLRPGAPPSLLVLDAPPPGDELAALDPAYLRFTSGTTSERKGVVISHPRILERLAAANRGMRISRDDRVMWLLPMAHHFVVSILLYLRHGATVLLPSGSLAQPVLELAERSSATVFYASPYHYGLLAADVSSRRLDSVRLAVSTAEGLREENARRFRDRYGIDLVQALGIIEVGLPVMNLAAAATKPTALGRPLPDYEVWLRGEDGSPVAERGAADRCGEICIRGPGMFDAYLDPWTPSRQVLEPDGFRTGDQGWFDADGDLRMVGRRANRINMAGMKFFAEEVEAVLDSHPAVRRSRVLAREHAHLGQIPVAEIVLAPGCEKPKARQLADFCKERLPAYKIPRQFEIVAALPLTVTGKVRRTGVRSEE
jgi:long-chain acyl-CoA synthetase